MSQELNGQVVEVEGRKIEQVDSVGIIVTWTGSGEADLVAVSDAFAKVGMGELAPKARSLREALKAALVAQYSKKNRRVAPTPRGYEVVEEVANEDGLTNSHRHVMSAWVEKHAASGGEVIRCDDAALFADLSEAVEACKKRVEGAVVAESLVDVAQKKLHGMKLRDGGGVYWLPKSNVGTWFTLTDALESIRGGITTRPFTVSGDDRTIKSVVESGISKVEAAVNEVYEKIAAGQVGPRALKTAAETVAALAEQVTTWEETLGASLEALRTKVFDAQIAATRAASALLQKEDASAE
jgi:hypothetical protein